MCPSSRHLPYIRLPRPACHLSPERPSVPFPLGAGSSPAAGRLEQPESFPPDHLDHMSCEDPKRSSNLSREMNYYRERHCPEKNELCLAPLPVGYKVPVMCPESLDKIWHSNMPHNKIADRKGHRGWMKVEWRYFIFPSGGTMFPAGAGEYVEKLKPYMPLTGGTLRTALDMGCGLASFSGYLLAEGILTMSFNPSDSHKSQIQFALERGNLAFVAMLGTRRFYILYRGGPASSARRILGHLWPSCAWAKQEKEWADLQAVAKGLCYAKIAVEGNTVIWKKPISAACFSSRNEMGLDLCDESDNPSISWYFQLTRCISRTSYFKGDYAIELILKWPERLNKVPSRYTVAHGRNNFEADTSKWAKRVAYYKKSLKTKLGTPAVRNVMDLNAFFGGFAASRSDDLVWVMNVVPARKP